MLSQNPNKQNTIIAQVLDKHIHSKKRFCNFEARENYFNLPYILITYIIKHIATIKFKLKYFLILSLPFSAISQDILNISDNKQIQNIAVIEEIGEHKYVPLKDNKVYDIEIIVFAYLNPLPNYKTFKNKVIFDDSAALRLRKKPDDLPYIQEKSDIETDNSEELSLSTTETTSSEFTVPIEDEEENKQVLAWFKHGPEKYNLTPIWERLRQQQTIIPLIHQAWRQSETPFENPTYVKISNLISDQAIDEDTQEDETNLNNVVESFDAKPLDLTGKIPVEETLQITASSIIENTLNSSIHVNADLMFLQNQLLSQENYEKENFEFFQESINTTDTLKTRPLIYSDFSVTGMVALSQGRFMHFGNSLNLFRLYNEEDSDTPIKNMVLSLVERRQTKADELHYFDSPWLGSIVKIIEYTGESENDENNEKINE